VVAARLRAAPALPALQATRPRKGPRPQLPRGHGHPPPGLVHRPSVAHRPLSAPSWAGADSGPAAAAAAAARRRGSTLSADAAAAAAEGGDPAWAPSARHSPPARCRRQRRPRRRQRGRRWTSRRPWPPLPLVWQAGPALGVGVAGGTATTGVWARDQAQPSEKKIGDTHARRESNVELTTTKMGTGSGSDKVLRPRLVRVAVQRDTLARAVAATSRVWSATRPSGSQGEAGQGQGDSRQPTPRPSALAVSLAQGSGAPARRPPHTAARRVRACSSRAGSGVWDPARAHPPLPARVSTRQARLGGCVTQGVARARAARTGWGVAQRVPRPRPRLRDRWCPAPKALRGPMGRRCWPVDLASGTNYHSTSSTSFG